jgi:hypothetical protein
MKSTKYLSIQKNRQNFGSRDYSPAGVNNYSSGGSYMQGGNRYTIL